MSNNKKGAGAGIGVGGSSILVIFVVLCLTTFATLSLVSANADYRLTKMAAEAAKNYYAADGAAEEKLAELAAVLQTQPPEALQGALEQAGFVCAKQDGTLLISYQIAMPQEQTLYVQVDAKTLERLCWQVRVSPDAPAESDGNAGLSNLPIL